MARRAWCSLTLALSLTLAPCRAGADLGRDVERLMLAWSAFGHVKRLPPRLLERGDVLPLVLPAEPLDPKTPGCVTLAVLATTGTSFLLDPTGSAQSDPDGDWPEGSLAGALELTRCGEKKPALAGLTLELRSPRAVLEFVIVESDDAPAHLVQVLPHRDPGPVAPLGGSGPRPAVAPLSLRLRAAEERAARDQAIELTVQDLVASPTGMGSALITLAPGCHRFDLLGDETGRRPADVDFDVRSEDGSELLAADHSESTDARALFCVGRPMPVTLRFAGAGPFAKLALARSRWDLEPNLPARWPAEARARFSGVLRNQRVSLSRAELIDESLGVQGDTLQPIAVEPAACYVAVGVQLRGDAAVLSMAARTSRGIAQSRLDPEVAGALVSFCAGGDERALVEIDARGLGLVWMSAVFRVGRSRLGEGGE
ncbi:MAG TPA: hypothetical protein VGK73_14250 [Polyangiaceae bacterium]